MYLESIATDEYTFKIKKNDSGKVFVFCDSEKFTLIPQEFYSSGLKDYYFFLAHEKAADEVILENKIFCNKYHILFTVKDLFKIQIGNKFPSAEFVHYTTALTLYAHNLGVDNKPVAIVARQKNYFYLVICNNSELMLLNSYGAKYDSDICYYTLNGLRNTGVDLQKAEIWYSGLPNETDLTTQLLRKYLPNIRKINSEDSVNKEHPFFSHF